MDLTLVALGVLVLARVLDATALRGLSADARAAIETALVRPRIFSFVALLVALAAGAIAYFVSPGIAVHQLIFGILLASVLVQAILGGASLARARTEGRYTAVYIGSRLVTAIAVGLLLVS